MKTTRLVLIFALFGVALVACAWVLGFISEGQMVSLSGRVIGVVAILGAFGGLTFALSKVPPSQDGSNPRSRPNEPGPKF